MNRWARWKRRLEDARNCPRCWGSGLLALRHTHPWAMSKDMPSGVVNCSACEGTGRKRWAR